MSRAIEDIDRRGGSSLVSLGKKAGVAAAAIGGLAVARNAVSATTDLAKATLALNRNLGLSVQFASEFAAVAKSRGIETRTLAVSFATLSRNVTEANRGTEKQVLAFRRLGLSQKDLQAGTRNFEGLLMKVADGFGRLRGGTERAALAQRLFGRGAQQIIPLFRQGSASLKEQIDLANKYGATLRGKSIKSVSDLIAVERRLKLQQLGLQVQFTEKVAPALIKVGLAFSTVVDLVDKSIRGYRLLGRAIKDTFVSSVNTAISAINKLISAYNAVPILPDVGGVGRLGGGGGGGRGAPAGPRGPLPRRARGGWASGLTVVGEEGPEIAALPMGTRVYSHPASKRMMRSALAAGIPGMANGGVARTIFRVGRGLNASPKVMLAAFEAALVESNMENLRYGDRDSLGVFQQRPSMGWGTPAQVTNVAYAARQFFTRAIRANRPGMTAGQLAQAVQRSAFPGRYDQRRAEALGWITRLSRGNRQAPRRRTVGRRAPARRTSGGSTLTALDRQILKKEQDIALATARGYDPAAIEDTEDSLARLLERRAARRGRSQAQANEDLVEAATLRQRPKPELNDNLAEMNELLKQQIMNQKQLFSVSQSQYGVLAQALAGVVSGQIGGRIGLGTQSPSFAGGTARY